MIFSADLEKHTLAGLLKFKPLYHEIGNFLEERDFGYDINKTIYKAIVRAYENDEDLNHSILIGRIKLLNLVTQDGIDPADYIDAFKYIQCTESSVKQAVSDLKRLTKRRDFIDVADNIKKQMIHASEMSYEDIQSFVDKTFYEQMNHWSSSSDSIDLFESMFERAFEMGANPVEEMGWKTPHKMFNERYGGLMKGNVYVFCARPKQGKAHVANTLIPTPYGFSEIKDLKIGDEVFAIDGSITKVIGTALWRDRDVYKVTAKDGAEVFADESHDWIVKRRHDYPWEKLTTKQISENPLKEGRRCKLPLQGALQLPKKDLLIDPYIFGIWLGDGWSNAAGFTNIDTFIVDKCKAYCVELGMNFKCYENGKDFRFLVGDEQKGNKFTNMLRELGVIGNKHIPQSYLRSSIEQRKKLLQGLIDSDGFVNLDGQVEFSSKWKHLSEQVVELINSLGIKGTIKKTNVKLNGKNCSPRYRVTFYYEDAALMPRKREKCKSAEKKQYRYVTAEYYGKSDTVCIEIEHPSHLFLCGKGMLPTHNSSFLNSTAFQLSNISSQIPCLILDTEMQDDEVGDRLLSSLTGINTWYIRTGNWSRNKEMVDKIKRARTLALQKKYQLHHEYVINCPIEKIVSKIKRWYYTKVGRGNPCVIVYDYIKLTGEALSGHYKEYQAIGDKITTLKDLVGKEINAPLMTAIQLNRAGEYKKGEQNDDASAIALSDRALWFASYVGIFRRKNFQELEEEGNTFGTHKLITVESRWQGKSSFGHNDYVKKLDGGITRNFINFDVENFNVKENSSAEDMFSQISVNKEVSSEEKPEESSKENPFGE